jgi:hypothetical protein
MQPAASSQQAAAQCAVRSAQLRIQLHRPSALKIVHRGCLIVYLLNAAADFARSLQSR